MRYLQLDNRPFAASLSSSLKTLSKFYTDVSTSPLFFPEEEIESQSNHLKEHNTETKLNYISSLKNEKTFNISVKDSAREYTVNPKFRKYVEEGDFVYVDGHFVIDDQKYIKRELGHLSLTDYAMAHLEECCIRFDIQPAENCKPKGEGCARACAYCKETSSFMCVPTFEYDKYSEELLHRSQSLAQLTSNAEEYRNFMAQTANLEYAETVYAHIRRLGLNQVIFSERTLLDDRQYRKYKSGTALRPTFDTVMAICVGLDLGLEYGEHLIDKAGYSLNGADRLPYRMLLAFYRGHNILECNEYLIEQGVKPIRESAYWDFIR